MSVALIHGGVAVASTKQQAKAPEKGVMKRERLVVTPTLAKAFLDKNVSNRNPSRRHVVRLARDMKRGNWAYTGDPIRFDVKGDLIDGQHRLMACIEADASFETDVIYNVPLGVQSKIDGGRPRTAADILTLSGMHYASNVAAAARMLLGEKHDVNPFKEPWTTSDIQEFLARHPKLQVSARVVRGRPTPHGISTSQIVAVHYVGAFLLGNDDAADSFVRVLHTGVPAYEGDPVHLYRERLIRDSGASVRMTRERKWDTLKHVWNLFAAGNTITLLRAVSDVKFAGLKTSSL